MSDPCNVCMTQRRQHMNHRNTHVAYCVMETSNECLENAFFPAKPVVFAQ